MFEVIIKNLLGIKTHGQSFLTRFLAEAWVSDCTEKRFFGKPEGWYSESELIQEEIATATDILPIDEEHFERRFLIPSQFSVEIVDITQEYNKQLYIQKKDENAIFGQRLVRELQFLNSKRYAEGELNINDLLLAKSKLATIQGHLIDGDPELAKYYIENYTLDKIITLEVKNLFLGKINTYLGAL